MRNRAPESLRDRGPRCAPGTLLDGTSRLRLDGATLQHCLLTSCFAERVVLAGAGAILLPEDVPLWQAALLGCGAVTGIGAVRYTARVRSGESVCVPSSSPSSSVSSSTGSSSSPISHVTDLDDVEDALDRLRSGEGARTIVVLDSELAGAPA